jgi:pimeloyl-ACP methyl ester carboxylesterase
MFHTSGALASFIPYDLRTAYPRGRFERGSIPSPVFSAVESRAVSILRSFGFLLAFGLPLFSGCTHPPATVQTSLKANSLVELQQYVLKHKSDVDVFRLRGPFTFEEQEDREFRLTATERINADLFLSSTAGKAPLVVFLHGLDSTKRAHAYQAMHLASWGMHCLTVELPNRGPWVMNGRTLARLVTFIHRAPQTIDSRIDANKIILVGHSFGGSSVAVALAEGAPAAGGILLDPAAIGKDLPNFLRRVSRPVMVLAADDEVSWARNRDYFYRFIRSGIAEVSIKNAAHEDAQYPSEYALENFGNDPHTTEESQLTFVSALTSAAISLSATGTFDYAWTSFGHVLENRKFFNAKKK